MSLFSKIAYKALALSAALFLSAQGLSAGNYLIVKFSDGTATSFDLEYRPDVTFRGDKMVIDAKTLTAEYDIADVRTFRVGDEDAAIDKVLSDNEVRLTYTDRDRASVSGIAPGTRVSVYSTDGIMHQGVNADQTGEASLDLSALPKGVYLITVTNGQTFKIAR